MITALVAIGRIGKRMGQEIPRQFITVKERPITTYTLESSQEHPFINRILIVCKKGWEQTPDACARGCHIGKLQQIIPRRNPGQGSINNGVNFLKEHSSPENTTATHDGIHPLVGELVLSDAAIKYQEHGNAVTLLPYNEQTLVEGTEGTTRQYVNHETLRRMSTPQAYKFERLTWTYKKAFHESIGISESSYTNVMMVDLGETLYLTLDSDKNIKLATQGDLQLFKGFLRTREE